MIMWLNQTNYVTKPRRSLRIGKCDNFTVDADSNNEKNLGTAKTFLILLKQKKSKL